MDLRTGLPPGYLLPTHVGAVGNPEAYAVMGPHLPQECEFFGFDENGGFDDNDQLHCEHYVDAEDPDAAVRASWKGTRR